MNGEIEGALKRCLAVSWQRKMEVSGYRSRAMATAMAMISIMFVILNSSLQIRINERARIRWALKGKGSNIGGYG